MTSGTECERYRGLLAADAVGGLDDEIERAGLEAHLGGCADCRADADDVTWAAGALAWIGPTVAEELARTGAADPEVAPTGALDAAVAGILAGHGTSGVDDGGAPGPRSRHRLRVLVPVLAVAASLLVVGAFGLVGHHRPPTRSVAMTGPGGGRATAVLTAESWGTSITLTDPARRASQVLTVSMTTEYGRLWNAGSYRVTASHGVTVTVACALPIDQIRTIAVTDAGGRVVLAGLQSGASAPG